MKEGFAEHDEVNLLKKDCSLRNFLFCTLHSRLLYLGLGAEVRKGGVRKRKKENMYSHLLAEDVRPENSSIVFIIIVMTVLYLKHA